MRSTLWVWISVLSLSFAYSQTDSVYTQAYLDKSTRFAWFTYGGDFLLQTGGKTAVVTSEGIARTTFGNTILPRVTIGGIHFWGHVDFYVSFPLSFLTVQDVPALLSDLEVGQGVETGIRLFPLKLQEKRFSPFVGISFRRLRYSQTPAENNFSKGTPSYGRMIHPLQFGATYTSGKFHFSASAYYNYQNSFDYFT